MTELTCPNADELQAFLNDELAPADDGRIAAHIDECQQCSGKLTTCVNTEDTADDANLATVMQAGRMIPADVFVGEESCEEALRRAESISKSLDDESADAMDESFDSPPVPDRLGPYVLECRIGAGGMGAVYKATHSKLGRHVAIKVLHAHRLHRADAVARFEREMRAIGKLQHPNIVQATDADEDDGVHYLVMEFIDGIDLSQLVRRLGRLPAAEACEVIRQAAEGLQFAHENGLVHRDIKPANLMLSGDRGPNSADGADGTECRATVAPHSVRKAPRHSAGVKILDLGLAVLGQSDEDGITSTGQVMGTIDYMAPEQLDETQSVGIRADIYSLGATLYKLLTGHGPCDSGHQRTRLQKLKAVAAGDSTPIAERRDDLPHGLVRVITRMLAPDPDKRFATPADVAAALSPFCAGADLAGLLTKPTVLESEPESSSLSSPAVAIRCHRLRFLASLCLAIFFAGAVYLGAIQLMIRSPEGTILLEFDDPRLIGSVVTIDDEQVITITSASHSKPLRISADGRERALKIISDGIPIFSRRVALKPDENRTIEVTWLPVGETETLTSDAADARTRPSTDTRADGRAKENASADELIVESGWRVQQIVQFEQELSAAVINPHDGLLYCVTSETGVFTVDADGTRQKVLDPFTSHPAIALEEPILFYSVPTGGNHVAAIDLRGGDEFCRIDCSEGDNDIGTIAFAPPGFVTELLGPHQGLALDVGHLNPKAIFRFDWKTEEVDSIVDNAEILRCPEGAYGDLTIGKDTIYASNTSHLFQLKDRTLVPLNVELPAVSDIAFDPVTSDLLVQSDDGVVRVDPTGKRPVRNVFRGILPDLSNRLRFSSDGSQVVVCDVPTRRVIVFVRIQQ